ncbi:hypothetical protein GCM10020000_32630 [Streptomyces olivoverticillatus]
MRLTDARRTLATGEAEDAAGLFRALRTEAAALALPGEEAAALLGLGDCALETGDLTEARDRFAEAEALLSHQPLPRRVPALRGRATAHLLAGELRYSCYLLETALDELNASGMHDPDALLLLYTASIAPYMDMGAHARAAHAAELALALAPQVDDPALVASMHRGVARTLIAEGRIAEADASLAKAQELYQQLHIRTELAHCHWMRGYVHAQDGNLKKRPRASCAPPATCSPPSAPPCSPCRSRWSWPMCCAAGARPRRRRSCSGRCWRPPRWAPSGARCTRAARTGCWG